MAKRDVMLVVVAAGMMEKEDVVAARARRRADVVDSIVGFRLWCSVCVGSSCCLLSSVGLQREVEVEVQVDDREQMRSFSVQLATVEAGRRRRETVETPIEAGLGRRRESAGLDRSGEMPRRRWMVGTAGLSALLQLLHGA